MRRGAATGRASQHNSSLVAALANVNHVLGAAVAVAEVEAHVRPYTNPV